MSNVTVTTLEPAFSDARGAITDILNADQEIHHIGIITFSEGAVRANHYHHQSHQYDYVLAGRIELRTRVASDEFAPVRTDILLPNQLASIPAGVIHAYKALEPSSMIDVTTLSRSGNGYEDDTVRVPSLF